MLEPPDRFPFLDEVAAFTAVARDEVERLPADAWLPWTAGNASGVEVFPLLMAYRPPWIDERFEARRARCPRTWAWLRQRPYLYGAVFSSLAPGGRILPHRDLEEPDSLRCHLPLSVPPTDASFRVGDVRFRWQPGRPVLFHPRYEHEGHNDGDRDRVLLILDVHPDELPTHGR